MFKTSIKGLFFISLVFLCRESFATSPDIKSYEIRRPLPLLMPSSAFHYKTGLFLSSEFHQGIESITVSDGTRLSEGARGNASVGAWLPINDSISVSFLAQIYQFQVFMPLGAQLNWLLVHRERWQLEVDVLYTGNVGIVFPSGAAQGVLKYQMTGSKNMSTYVLLGVGWGTAFHFFHKVKNEGVSTPSARYTGYLTTQFNFIGVEVTYKEFFITSRISSATRSAGSNSRDRNVGAPAENYTAKDGAFVSINVGMVLRGGKR